MAKIEVDAQLMSAVKRILDELHDDAEKWGGSDHDFDYIPEVWITMLAEELGGLAKATTREDHRKGLRKLVKLAAVSVSAIVAYERLTAGMQKTVDEIDDDDDE